MAIQAPSLANLNLLDFGEKMRELTAADLNLFHIDLMDGHYVPNLCLPACVVRDIKRDYPDVKLDVHLMVDNPEDYVDLLAADGADYLSFHVDSTRFTRRLLRVIRAKGMKAGVVINPSQPVDVIKPFAADLDYVTLMAVEPGFAGQRCIDGTVQRVGELSGLRRELGADFQIFMDGGMSYGVIEACVKNGADVIITGIYAIFEQPDGISGAAQRFRRTMEEIACGEREEIKGETAWTN